MNPDPDTAAQDLIQALWARCSLYGLRNEGFSGEPQRNLVGGESSEAGPLSRPEIAFLIFGTLCCGAIEHFRVFPHLHVGPTPSPEGREGVCIDGQVP